MGYWFGGQLADRHPDPRLLGTIVLVAALGGRRDPVRRPSLLDATVRELDSASVGAVVGSFVAALALFAVPVTLLGTVSPFAIRLALPAVENAGATAGRLYALSTIGSILGTFVAAIVAIPFVGTQRTLIATAALLAVAAGLLLGPRWQLLALVLAALLAVPPGAIKSAHGLLYEGESRYQYIDVREKADGSRVLELNEGVVANSVWYPNSVLTGGEWDMFLVVPPLVTHPVRNVLVLGNAGGSTARALAALYPGVEDRRSRARSEGDRRRAPVPRPRRIPGLHVFTADARAYLRSTSKRYDADHDRHVPAAVHPIPGDDARVLRARPLAPHPGGAVALNVARFPDDRGLLDSIAATVRDRFGQAWTWDALRFNTLLVAFESPVTRAELVRRVGGAPAPVRSLVPLFRREVSPAGFHGGVLTDDRAPVEWLADRAIVSYVAGGGRLEDDHLPTRP